MAARTRLASNLAQDAGTSAGSDSENDHEQDAEDCGNVRGWSPAKGGSKKSKYICRGGQKVCGVSISSKDDSIMCDSCKEWFHPKCQGLSVDAFRALSKYDFLWLCIHCKPKFEALLEVGKGLELCIEKAEKRITDAVKESRTKNEFHVQLKEKIQQMEKSVDQIKEQQAKIELTMNEQKKVVETVPRYSEALRNSAQQIQKIVDLQGKDSRQNNVILHNIPESSSQDAIVRKQHDSEVFQKVVEALLGKNAKVEVTQIFRLGKKQNSGDQGTASNGKPRLMLLKLKEKEQADSLIKRRTNLKDAGFPNVYLTRDLTPEEREIQRTLREELKQKGKETHRIFHGKVVPRI